MDILTENFVSSKLLVVFFLMSLTNLGRYPDIQGKWECNSFGQLTVVCRHEQAVCPELEAVLSRQTSFQDLS